MYHVCPSTYAIGLFSAPQRAYLAKTLLGNYLPADVILVHGRISSGLLHLENGPHLQLAWCYESRGAGHGGLPCSLPSCPTPRPSPTHYSLCLHSLRCPAPSTHCSVPSFALRVGSTLGSFWWLVPALTPVSSRRSRGIPHSQGN